MILYDITQVRTPFMNSTYITTLFAVAMIILTASPTTALGQLAPADSEAPQERILGDKAFNEGVYDLAVKFYKEYRDHSSGNTDAILDAYECLIAAYLKSGNAQQARNEFNTLTTKFAESIAGRPELRKRLTYWDGCITMDSGNPRKASEIFRKLLDILPEKMQHSELYFSTLDALGTAEARTLQWIKAEKTYATMEFAGRGTKWQPEAAKKRLMAIIMMGDYKKAASLINRKAKNSSVYIEVIRGILLLNEGYIAKAFDHYKKIRKSAIAGDPVWFMLATGLADAFQEKKDYKKALFLLNDSLLFANSEFDRQQTLVKIINAAVADNNFQAAIMTAERFLKNYPESFISNEIRLKLAQLYANAKNPEKQLEDAIQVLLTLINDNTAQPEVKIKSAREAAHIYIKMKRYSDAANMFKYLQQNGPTPQIKGEGAYWIAELQYIQDHNKEAALLFASVAEKYPEWREKALFKEIKSLMNTTEHKTTEQKLKDFIKEFPKGTFTPNAEFLYALALKNNGNRDKAEQQFAKFAEKYPSHKYAPRALFEEGLLEMDSEKFQPAVSAFTQLYKKYPASSLVPNVLYRRVYALFWEKFDKEAIDDVHLLTIKYPDSPYTVFARFRLAAYYANNHDIINAVKALTGIAKDYEKRNKHASARAYYEMANLFYHADQKEKAFAALDDLSEKFPNDPINRYALFLRGDIYSGNNEFEKAIPFYIKAAKSSPVTLLAASSEGRTGDCYFALGDKTEDGSNYLKAIEYYKKVLAFPKLPPYYRDQALYKIGISEEQLGDKGSALSRFREIMIRHDVDRNENKAVARSSVWFAKAGLKAANLYLAKKTPEAAEAAIAVYQALIKAGVQPRNDFIHKIEIIRNKYKLKE